MSEFDDGLRDIIMKVWLFSLPVLIIVSTIANCLCIIVTFRTGLKDMVSRYYFIGMTIANEASLLCLGLTWILGIIQRSTNIHSDYTTITNAFYVLSIYLPSFLHFLTNYFILALVVERFKATRFPPRREELKTTKIITLGITILGILPVAYWVYVHDAIHDHAFGNRNILHIFVTIMRAIICELGPYITIIVLSAQIFTMIRRKSAMGNMVTNTANGTDEVSRQQSSNTMSVQETKITKMLVIVAVVFVSLNIVSVILGLLFLIQIDWANISFIMRNISHLFVITSLGITFFVCCAVDQDFKRTGLAAILCRRYLHSGVSQRVLYTRGNHELNAPILMESSANSTVFQKTTNPKANVQLGGCANV